MTTTYDVGCHIQALRLCLCKLIQFLYLCAHSFGPSARHRHHYQYFARTYAPRVCLFPHRTPRLALYRAPPLSLCLGHRLCLDWTIHLRNHHRDLAWQLPAPRPLPCGAPGERRRLAPLLSPRTACLRSAAVVVEGPFRPRAHHALPRVLNAEVLLVAAGLAVRWSRVAVRVGAPLAFADVDHSFLRVCAAENSRLGARHGEIRVLRAVFIAAGPPSLVTNPYHAVLGVLGAELSRPAVCNAVRRHRGAARAAAGPPAQVHHSLPFVVVAKLLLVAPFLAVQCGGAATFWVPAFLIAHVHHSCRCVPGAVRWLFGPFETVRRPGRTIRVGTYLGGASHDVNHSGLRVPLTELRLLASGCAVRPPNRAASIAAPLAVNVDHTLFRVRPTEPRRFRPLFAEGRDSVATFGMGALPAVEVYLQVVGGGVFDVLGAQSKLLPAFQTKV